MKAARVVVLGIAVAAGGIAALLAGRSDKPAQVKQVAAPKSDTVDILVAKEDIPTGKEITPADVKWQPWPKTTASGNFVRKNDRPNAIEKMSGLLVRAPFVAGEPIREAKLVNAKGSGYMAAILPSGMRAVSTQISPETGAGGFILPNDHVDVILTRRDPAATKATGVETQTSETILTNVRVLAIDQTVQEKNGQKVVVGKTATIELTPSQVETLTLSRHLGSLSLALRSITDANKTEAKNDDGHGRRGSVNMIRYGVNTPTTTQ